MRTLRNPSGWKRKIFLLFTSATSDFEKKPKHLHRFFFSSLSLAQSPYFHNYFHNFLAYFALRNGKKRWKKKRSSSAAGRAGSTFPLKRPLNHNLFGPSFHRISLKMIHALFAAENFLVRLWKFSRIRVENGNAKPNADLGKIFPEILEFLYRPILLEFPLKTETRTELSNFSQICFQFTIKQKKIEWNKNKKNIHI